MKIKNAIMLFFICLPLAMKNNVFSQNQIILTAPENPPAAAFLTEDDSDAIFIAPSEIKEWNPELVSIADDGKIWIADKRKCVIALFDSNGLMISKMDRSLRTGESFQYISSMMAVFNDQLLVLDSGTRKTLLVDPYGRVLKSLQWNLSGKNTLDKLLTADLNGYTVLARQVALGTPERLFSEVHQYDWSGRLIKIYGPFPDGDVYQYQTSGQMSLIGRIPQSLQFQFCGNAKAGNWSFYDNQKMIVHIHSSDEQKIQIKKTYPLTDFAHEDKQLFYQSLHQRGLADFSQVQLPAKRLAIQNMLSDESGNVWLKTSKKEIIANKTYTAWDVFNAEGAYLQRIWLFSDPAAVTLNSVFFRKKGLQSGQYLIARYPLKRKIIKNDVLPQNKM